MPDDRRRKDRDERDTTSPPIGSAAARALADAGVPRTVFDEKTNPFATPAVQASSRATKTKGLGALTAESVNQTAELRKEFGESVAAINSRINGIDARLTGQDGQLSIIVELVRENGKVERAARMATITETTKNGDTKRWAWAQIVGALVAATGSGGIIAYILVNGHC